MRNPAQAHCCIVRAVPFQAAAGADYGIESSFEAVCREVLEETGVDVSKADGGYCFCYHRENKGQNYIVDIYRFEMDITDRDVRLQTDEDIDGKFATSEEIRAIAEEGKFLHYSSIKAVFE